MSGTGMYHPDLRKPDYSWNAIGHSQKISEHTRKRMKLVRLLVAMPRKPTEHQGAYVTRIAKLVNLDPVEADKFLFGALYRKDV